MAVNIERNSEDRPPTSYSGMVEQLKVPKTPLESRQGYHPKGEDQLIWKSPPTRQLSNQRRIGYESDVRERFYDDYLGERATGDANNEVLTQLGKLKFDPNLYRANACQGLVYDPMRTVPAGLNLTERLKAEREREKQSQMQQYRQRRLSDSQIPSRSIYSRGQRLEPLPVQGQLTGNQTYSNQQTRSGLQKELEISLAPEVIPGVEDWLTSANLKDKEVAANFFRTLSSHGKRPDPASRAALHHTRVRSAVITPTRKEREEKSANNIFQQLSRETATLDQDYPRKPSKEQPRVRKLSTERMVTKGSMFTAKRQQPSHFTVHPDWASEGVSRPKK